MNNPFKNIVKIPHSISEAQKCVGGWESASEPAGELMTLPRPHIYRKGHRAFDARHSLFRVHFLDLKSPSGPLPYWIPGSATDVMHVIFGSNKTELNWIRRVLYIICT